MFLLAATSSSLSERVCFGLGVCTAFRAAGDDVLTALASPAGRLHAVGGLPAASDTTTRRAEPAVTIFFYLNFLRSEGAESFSRPGKLL